MLSYTNENICRCQLFWKLCIILKRIFKNDAPGDHKGYLSHSRGLLLWFEEQQNMFFTDLLIMKGSFAISNDIMSSLVSGKYLQGINLSIQENHYWPSGLKTATEKLTSCQTFTQYDIFLLLIYQLQYSLLSHTALKERQVNLHVEGRFFMPPLPLFTQKRKDNVTNNTLKMAWRQQMCILFSRQSISLFLRSTFKCQWVHLSFTCLYSELFPSYMVL